MIKNLLIFIFILAIFNNYIFAQSGGLVGKNCTPDSCTLRDFINAVQNVIRFLLILGYWIAALVALIGAFMMMFGGATKNWLEKGRTMMVNAVTYYVLLLLAGIFFDLILDFLKPKIYTGH